MTIGIGTNVKTKLSDTTHPDAFVTFAVSVTVPVVSSAVLGIYVDVGIVIFENEPEPEVVHRKLAPADIVPFKFTAPIPAQRVKSVPALLVGKGAIVRINEEVVVEHVPPVPVIVIVTVPAVISALDGV